MSLEAGLYTYLTANISEAVHPNHLPEDATLPSVVYHLVSANHAHHLLGGAGIAETRVQLDIIANTLSEVVTLAETIRGLMQGYMGTMGSETVCFVQLLNEQNLDEHLGGGNYIYRRSVDYLIKYRVS